ncbi:MAG: hypothetical protein JNL21_34630 [Myxococcales bacterium]|nr:hypothetical protein [Myxococcales bacterium]
MQRRSTFFSVGLFVSFAALAAACGDDGGSGGGGGSTTTTTGSESTTDGTSVASTTETSTSASTGMIVDPCEGAGIVSFAADVAPVLEQKCATANCHVGSMADGGLDLGAMVAHANTVGHATKSCGGDRTRVIAGDPAESYLWDKIMGTDLCGTSKKMPPATKPQLDAAEIQAITDWICGGALDD